MIENVYRWIWERIGGRPWTYIMRDNYMKYPLLWIIGALEAGLAIGVVLAHLFW